MRRLALSLLAAAVLVSVVPVLGQGPGGAATAPATMMAAPPMPDLTGKLGAPVQLFNGKDLEGWTWVAGPAPRGKGVQKIDDVWTVKDGVLHVAANTGTGVLRGNKDYTEFVLVVEQRHITKGNGGILFGITGPDKVWPREMQVQGQYGDVGDLINQGAFKMTTDPARTTVRPTDTLVKKIGPVSEPPMGEWYVVETTVYKGNIWAVVNGKLQNWATNVEPLPGKIGLQDEGAEMEFRKIEVRPIEAGK